jgi:hypothetical protein
MMTIRYHLAIQVGSLLILFLSSFCWAQQAEFFPLAEVKPGLKGIGKTIFKGIVIEEFNVEILGVIEKIRPRRNLILARLSGTKIERTGVFAGMSGSPVYIEGKLLGAVAFAFPFSKEPITGITPIQEMVRVFQGEAKPARSWSPQTNLKNRLQAFGLGREFDTPPKLPSMAVDLVNTKLQGTLEPIAAPLSLTGVEPRASNKFHSDFKKLGLVPISGITSVGTDFERAPVMPGSTIIAHLVTGDLEVSAAGTITSIDGDRIYAFGHPFLGLGFTSMPMSSGSVITVIPSIFSSQKITAVHDPIGSIRQDRDTGILGLRGEKPDMVPISLRLVTSRSVLRQLNFQIVQGALLSPLLANFAVFNSIVSSERGAGPQAFRVEVIISVKGYPQVRYSRNVSNPANAARVVGGLLDLLLNSGFDDMLFEEVDVRIQSVEEQLKATLEQVWVDRKEISPGDKVNFKMILRQNGGTTIEQDYSLPIPEDMTTGPVYVAIGEGISLANSDADKDSGQFVPQNTYQLIRAINNLKKNDRLYVRLYRSSPGVVIAGEEMPSLPPSMLEIHNSGKSTGTSRPLSNVIHLEREMGITRFVLEGIKTIQLNVRS